MQSATSLIDSFINTVTQSSLLGTSCRAIRAYESRNLPVPIKMTYFSFSAAESSLSLTQDENGGKTEINSIKISVNCFIPLTLSPAVIYSLTETVMNMLMKSNENIIGFTVGKTVYDSDVDAFRINSVLHYRTEKQL